MPTSRSTTTIAMLVGTVAAAAGLNLSVLGLDQEPVDSSDDGATEVAQPAPGESGEQGESQAPAMAPPEGAMADIGAERAAPLVVVAANGSSPRAWSADSQGGTGAEPGDPATTAQPDPTPSSQQTSTSLRVTTQTTERPTTATTARPTTTVRPATTTPTTARQSTTVGDSTEYVTDEFRGFATIRVAIHGGVRLELISVSPVDGVSYQVEAQSATGIKIRFRSRSGDDDEADWHIRLVGGQPRIDKER